jgi:1,4-dihydroxy-6-naphthoate synthase
MQVELVNWLSKDYFCIAMDSRGALHYLHLVPGVRRKRKNRMRLSLGMSPCPNDTFMFYHLLNSGQFEINLTIADVEDLNERVLNHKLDISKVSLYTAVKVMNHYTILDSGAALGENCGPLLVARRGQGHHELKDATIAVPGRHTTANLLFTLFSKGQGKKVFMPFDQIMPAVQEGEVGFGVIIHEGRFTYQNYELTEIVDLGKWWTDFSRMPIPLGGIIAKNSLPEDIRDTFSRALHDSIVKAFGEKKNYRAPIYAFIREHAQEMDQDVIDRHIDLYVNDYSLSLGQEGRATIKKLSQLAANL